MKKRINLFIKKKKVSPNSISTDKINFYSTFIGIILFVVFLVFIFLQLQVQAQKSALLKEKQELYDFIIANKDDIAKMNIYTRKNTQLKGFLKDDAEFLPYYNLLKDALVRYDDAELNPVLDYMQIDKNKNTEFTVQFTEYPPAYEFLKVMESPEFLDNFIELKLVGFNLHDSPTIFSEKRGYELQFKGKFKPINGQ